MNATQILPFFVLVLLAVAVPVHAQTTVVANIPFDFIVHGHELPAGTYEVRLSDTASGIALIDNLKGSISMFTITIPAGGNDPAGEQPALVFDHRENRYVLAQIWESRREGEILPGTDARRPASHPLAGAGVDDTIVLAANRLP
jgi:hypothetical protein